MNGIGSVRLSVIMPVYNEATAVERAVRRVRGAWRTLELICVDDGSTDGTGEVLERLSEQGTVDILIRHRKNRGKGAAVRSAIPNVTGEIAVIHDADLEYDPRELPILMEPILDGRADAVVGSRFLGGPHRVLYFWHRVGNGLLTLLSNMMTDLNLTDMESCYKMMRADLLKALPLKANRFGFEPELTARLAQSRARVYELPISYSGRTYSEGKKIGWRDGVAALWHIARYNLLPPKAKAYAVSDSGVGMDSSAPGAGSLALDASGSSAETGDLLTGESAESAESAEPGGVGSAGNGAAGGADAMGIGGGGDRVAAGSTGSDSSPVAAASADAGESADAAASADTGESTDAEGSTDTPSSGTRALPDRLERER